MESSATPDLSPSGEVLQLIDQSIAFTPQPQASSTVNRKPKDSLPQLPIVLSNVKTETQALSSPHYLLNAIDGMRFLSSQLGSLNELSGDKVDRQSVSSTQNLRKAASLAHLYCDDRRASTVADSEANSSLGILKLDDCRDLEFSEARGDGNISDLLQKFRKDSLMQSLPEKENCEPNPVSTNPFSSEIPTSTADSQNKRRQVGSDISSTILNSDRLSSQSKIMEADLRLRLQKALAQRTMDRSLDSARLSQLSDSYDVDAFSIGNSMELVQADSTKDVGNSASTTSLLTSVNNTTFGAANFMSFSGSPAIIDSLSSENFQPADMAMDRLEKDENSWHRQFGDLPVFEDGDAVKSNPGETGHLTQNLDLSNMSGIIAGDITVNSSMMGDVGKRRLSAGEYFKLHTERLGGMSEDERPNFGHSIRSPVKSRPHPPLINMSPTEGVHVDEVPTRDSGFNKTLNFSHADTLNFSASESAQSQSTRHSFQDVQDLGLASRSIDLMPPPPNPKPHFKNIASDTRDSLSARLSVSLSLPRESHDGTFKDLNSSALSLDSGEKFVSISQMVKIMQDLPSGTKSARQLVDDFMQRCTVSEPKTQSSGFDQKVKDQNSQFAKDSSVAKTSVAVSSENSPSRNERVKQWISTINYSEDDSVFEREFGNTTCANYSYGDELPESLKRKFETGTGTGKGKEGKCTVKQERYSDLGNQKKKGSYQVYEDCVSVSSFMPPPTKTANPDIQFQNFSTPKAHEKQTVHKFSHQVAQVKPLDVHTKNKLERKSHQQLHGRLSLASRSSQGSDQQRGQSYGSRDQTDSKHSSHSSSSTLKSFRQRTSSQKSDYGSKIQHSDLKHSSSVAAPRPPSNCGSTRSISTTKSTTKQTDTASVTAGPLQIDSTHTQLSWASVSPGSSVTQTFALRNKALARVRLLVSSPSTAFKLVGERGEMLSELVLTLHSEETRRIHVVFSPLSLGPVVGKLVISRVITSESSSAMPEDRRLIALYGYGGKAELAVDGASKDRWAQLFLNMCTIECDTRSAASDIDGSHDAPQVVASFSIRNSGKVSAFVSLQIAEELPFDDCGVYVTPKDLSLTPGEVKRVSVRFDPGRDILQWLNKNADDMQLLANIWLSWSELATWQRIRRIYTKYYKSDKTGSLSTWGCLYTGDLGVGHELKDNKSSEAALAQAVRRLKVAVLIERERLNLFDMDATMVFDQLVANETAMFNSPQLNDKTMDSSEFFESPVIAGAGMKASDFFGSPTYQASSIKATSPLSSISSQNHHTPKLKECRPNELNVVTTQTSNEHQSFTLEFPPTTLGHKSKVKITLQNPSSQKNLVSVSDLSAPFSVSTPKLQVPPVSYATMSLFFRPLKTGIHHCTFNIVVDGNHVRSYLLRGEGIQL